jgi:hypothetical protein
VELALKARDALNMRDIDAFSRSPTPTSETEALEAAELRE